MPPYRRRPTGGPQTGLSGALLRHQIYARILPCAPDGLMLRGAPTPAHRRYFAALRQAQRERFNTHRARSLLCGASTGSARTGQLPHTVAALRRFDRLSANGPTPAHGRCFAALRQAQHERANSRARTLLCGASTSSARTGQHPPRTVAALRRFDRLSANGPTHAAHGRYFVALRQAQRERANARRTRTLRFGVVYLA